MYPPFPSLSQKHIAPQSYHYSDSNRSYLGHQRDEGLPGTAPQPPQPPQGLYGGQLRGNFGLGAAPMTSWSSDDENENVIEIEIEAGEEEVNVDPREVKKIERAKEKEIKRREKELLKIERKEGREKENLRLLQLDSNSIFFENDNINYLNYQNVFHSPPTGNNNSNIHPLPTNPFPDHSSSDFNPNLSQPPSLSDPPNSTHPFSPPSTLLHTSLSSTSFHKSNSQSHPPFRHTHSAISPSTLKSTPSPPPPPPIVVGLGGVNPPIITHATTLPSSASSASSSSHSQHQLPPPTHPQQLTFSSSHHSLQTAHHTPHQLHQLHQAPSAPSVTPQRSQFPLIKAPANNGNNYVRAQLAWVDANPDAIRVNEGEYLLVPDGFQKNQLITRCVKLRLVRVSRNDNDGDGVNSGDDIMCLLAPSMGPIATSFLVPDKDFDPHKVVERMKKGKSGDKLLSFGSIETISE